MASAYVRRHVSVSARGNGRRLDYDLTESRVLAARRLGRGLTVGAGLRNAVETPAVKTMIANAAARTRLSTGAGVAWETSALDVAYDGAGRWTIEARVRLWR